MKYLFFDIECANCDGGRGKICSFGYVLTDTSFSVIESEDIIINPHAPFRLRSYGKEQKSYIELAYPEEIFRAAPDFSFYYERIKSLLNADNVMIFGYAPENDAGFLAAEFERYSLPCVDFEFCDVQRIYKRHIKNEGGNQFSLVHACEDLGVASPETEHKSVDDAMATMRVLKRICFEEGRGAPELVDIFSPCKGELIHGNLEVGYFKKKAPPTLGEENFIKGINEDNFKKLIKRTKLSRICEIPRISGKKLCFSFTYEFYHYKEMCYLVKALAEVGARVTRKASECNVYVRFDTHLPDGRIARCRRKQLVDQRIGDGERVSIIDFKTLLELLQLDEESLERNSKQDD